MKCLEENFREQTPLFPPARHASGRPDLTRADTSTRRIDRLFQGRPRRHTNSARRVDAVWPFTDSEIVRVRILQPEKSGNSESFVRQLPRRFLPDKPLKFCWPVLASDPRERRLPFPSGRKSWIEKSGLVKFPPRESPECDRIVRRRPAPHSPARSDWRTRPQTSPCSCRIDRPFQDIR